MVWVADFWITISLMAPSRQLRASPDIGSGVSIILYILSEFDVEIGERVINFSVV